MNTYIMPTMKYGKSAMTTKINIAMWKNAKNWKTHVKRTHKFDKAIKDKNAIAFLIQNAIAFLIKNAIAFLIKNAMKV